MKIKRIKFQNYTVFEDQQMEFSPGINVIIGENGTGKTHLMKALYSAFLGHLEHVMRMSLIWKISWIYLLIQRMD